MSAAAEVEKVPPSEPLRTTALHSFHVARHAHLVPFAGWEMPLYYSGILAEHQAVRTAVGFFDVSHMGILTVTGGHSASLLSRRTTANVEKLPPGHCRYTFLLDFAGNILDDLVITRLDPGTDATTSFLVIPNAGTSQKVLELLRQHRRPDTDIQRWNDRIAILAVQGPGSRELLEKCFGWELGDLGFFRARLFPLSPGNSIPSSGRSGTVVPADLDQGVLVSRTGYTGELGYELFVSGPKAVAVAERLEEAGALPCGLGARDTLRLEKGYLLSGQDFHRDRTPLEAGQERFVDFDHPFVGRDSLEKQKSEGVKLRLSGLVVEETGSIPRHGTPVLSENLPIGIVTSGGLSPGLNQGIALAFLPTELHAPGSKVELQIRTKQVSARVVPLPFIRPTSARR